MLDQVTQCSRVTLGLLYLVSEDSVIMGGGVLDLEMQGWFRF